MISDVMESLLANKDLDAATMERVMEAMLTGDLTPAMIGGFLIGLRAKGESVTEIAAAARVMRRHAKGIPVPEGVPLLDTCGTGGDGTGTFNISTAAAIVAAAGGATVAKHGNRSVSSKSGSADVLEALGVNLSLPVERLGEVLEQVGISFLFAPAHHAATKHAVGPRRELGVRTLFNVLGPLTNPAGAKRQVMGVYAKSLVEPLATVLCDLGAEHAIVVHGADGLDEFSLSGESFVSEVRNGEVTSYTVTPGQVGLDNAPLSALLGGDAADNAKILRAIFAGEAGAPSDAVALNAGAALYVAGESGSLAEGVTMARELLSSGAAEAKLEELVLATNATVES
jgi:anthranilate phosphoribosyltransferase